MELKSNEYQIECTPYGEYYAFLTDYHQCCTYGETAEEALETLSDIAAFFVEVLSVTLTILPFSVVPSAFPVALDIVNDVTTIAALSKYAHILFCFRMFSPYLSVDY